MASYRNEQHEERLVVLAANAVIKPDTMMIKVLCASLTSTAVFRKLFYIRITMIAIEFIIAIIKFLICHPKVFLKTHLHVAWINSRRDCTKNQNHDI